MKINSPELQKNQTHADLICTVTTIWQIAAALKTAERWTISGRLGWILSSTADIIAIVIITPSAEQNGAGYRYLINDIYRRNWERKQMERDVRAWINTAGRATPKVWEKGIEERRWGRELQSFTQSQMDFERDDTNGCIWRRKKVKKRCDWKKIRHDKLAQSTRWLHFDKGILVLF